MHFDCMSYLLPHSISHKPLDSGPELSVPPVILLQKPRSLFRCLSCIFPTLSWSENGICENTDNVIKKSTSGLDVVLYLDNDETDFL